MNEWLIVILLLALVFWAGFTVRKRFTRGSACCGEREEEEKRVPVKDRNPKHYSHELELTIEGMTCENCARRVENALNRREGTWARVDIGTHRARVLLKEAPDPDSLTRAVRDAGYGVTEVQIKR